jgi:hypothetical protein
MAEEVPKIETTTGLKGWAGEFMPNPAVYVAKLKGGNMLKGDISNVPNPYIAFDFECLMYVLEEDRKRVGYLEKLPIPYLNKKSMLLYKRWPGSMERITDLIKVAYNIMVVYVGPRHLWSHRKALIEQFPYTNLLCINNPDNFREQVTLNPQVTVYYTLSAIKQREAYPKGVLFEDWGLLGIEKR